MVLPLALLINVRICLYPLGKGNQKVRENTIYRKQNSAYESSVRIKSTVGKNGTHDPQLQLMPRIPLIFHADMPEFSTIKFFVFLEQTEDE